MYNIQAYITITEAVENDGINSHKYDKSDGIDASWLLIMAKAALLIAASMRNRM